jgi:dienelactone hydrolase
MRDDLADFARSSFSHGGSSRTVYRKGEGPAVIVVAELPGITPEVADFARRLPEIGCTAVVPHLFGKPGKDGSPGYTLAVFGRACVSREFTTLATRKPSLVTDWLRALARAMHEDLGGPGVGVVGMCFTGGFALAMMVDDSVIAPVLSQPSLPLPVGRRRKQDLGISQEALTRVKARVADGVCVLGLRFSGDRMSPAERFQRLRDELGEGFIAVEIDSEVVGPRSALKSPHSVLTLELVDEPGHPTRDALDQVLSFLRDRLVANGGAGESPAPE